MERAGAPCSAMISFLSNWSRSQRFASSSPNSVLPSALPSQSRKVLPMLPSARWAAITAFSQDSRDAIKIVGKDDIAGDEAARVLELARQMDQHETCARFFRSPLDLG